MSEGRKSIKNISFLKNIYLTTFSLFSETLQEQWHLLTYNSQKRMCLVCRISAWTSERTLNCLCVSPFRLMFSNHLPSTWRVPGTFTYIFHVTLPTSCAAQMMTHTLQIRMLRLGEGGQHSGGMCPRARTGMQALRHLTLSLRFLCQVTAACSHWTKVWNLKGKEILNQAPSFFNDKLFPFHLLFLFNSHKHTCSCCQSSLHARLETRCPRGPQAVGVGYGERQTGTMAAQAKLWQCLGDRMPGIRCQYQPPRGPTAQGHPRLSWLKLSLLPCPDTQDPHISSTPVLRGRPNHSGCVTFAKTPTASKPQCFDLGNGKSGHWISQPISAFIFESFSDITEGKTPKLHSWKSQMWSRLELGSLYVITRFLSNCLMPIQVDPLWLWVPTWLNYYF